MTNDAGDHAHLSPEAWQRIGAVLDRLSDVDLQARPEVLADACHAEGVRLDQVEPFLDVERRSSRFPERLDPSILADALRHHDDTPASRLMSGDRLGPYEIIERLGAGGMGEVYQARDTRLGRIVAVKLLNASLATRPEGRARFAREARVISGLNHPHICTLYDVGAHEPGAGPEHSVDCLVMELYQPVDDIEMAEVENLALADGGPPDDHLQLALVARRGAERVETSLEFGAREMCD